MAVLGIHTEPLGVDTYAELRDKVAPIVGMTDHWRGGWHLLLEHARRGRLELSVVVTQAVPLEAGPINAALDRLERFGGGRGWCSGPSPQAREADRRDEARVLRLGWAAVGGRRARRDVEADDCRDGAPVYASKRERRPGPSPAHLRVLR
ncbi:MAG: hypothetical protein HPY83_01235 [Anaerolineae bacterium]|nr:hypothetical protein [Anaerolineae bacterium]